MRKGSFQSTMALLLSAGMLMSQCMTGVAAQSATYGEKYTKIEETSVIDESDVYYDVDGGLVYARSADTACSEQLASFDGNDYVLEAPTDLKWISSNRISYQSNNLDHVVYYSTEVFCDGESVGKYVNGSFVGNRMIAQCDEKGYTVWDISSCIKKSGTYTFVVSVSKTDSKEDEENAVQSETSPEHVYVSPETKLAVPNNLRWSDGTSGRAEWDAVPNAGGYEVRLYEDEDNKWSQQISTLSFDIRTYHDFLPYIGNTEEHSYTFTVQALSGDLDHYKNGEESEKSAVLNKLSSATDYTRVNEVWSDLESAKTPADAQKIVEDFINSTSPEAQQLKMQTDAGYRTVVGRVETEYKNKADISLAVNVNEDVEVSASRVSIKGGILNANAGEEVNFSISRPEANDNRALDPTVYSNVLRFDLGLTGASGVAEDGTLRYPVEVTMPIPKYFKDAPFMYVLHYHQADDGYDIIHPRVNDDYTISFTVTHFSEFAFATSVKDNGEGGDEDEKNATTLVAKQKLDVSGKFATTYKKYGVIVSPKGVATVNSKGLLTAKKAGTVKVFGYNKEGKKWVADEVHALSFTVEQPVISSKTVTLTKPEQTFAASTNVTGTTVKPTSYMSSKEKVATIDPATGLITAKANGVTKITILYGTDKNAAKYTFNVKVSMPTMNKKAASMLTGANLKLQLKNTKQAVSWRSSDETIATVNAGKVQALTAGSVQIIATVEGVDYIAEITVKAPEIRKSSLTVKVGKSGVVGLKNTKLKNVEWTSDDPSIATVDEKGRVKGVAAGTTTIRTNAGGVENSCTVTVK